MVLARAHDRRRAMNRSPWAFLGLLLALSLPFYVLGMVGPDLTKVLPIPLPLSALMFVCPAIAALCLTARDQGGVAVRGLLARVGDVERIADKRWLLPTFLLMPAVMVVVYAIQRGLGHDLPPVELSAAGLVLSFALFFVGAIGEELGWTAYLTAPFQRQYSALGAGLLIGAMWALWHVIPYLQAHRSLSWIAVGSVITVLQRLIMVWLYNQSGRSLFTAISYHAMINVSEFGFPTNGSHLDSAVFCAVLGLVTLLVVWCWGMGRQLPVATLSEVNNPHATP